MEQVHEIVNFGNQVPIKCFMHKLGFATRHWHYCIEILYVLDGSVNVIAADKSYTLNNDDILLINSGDAHELSSTDCTLIALQIGPEIFKNDIDAIEDLYFRLDSSNSQDKSSYANIKAIIAKMIKNSVTKAEKYELLNKSYAYEMLYALLSNFRSDRNMQPTNRSQKYMDRLNQILSIINEEYNYALSLSDVADRVHLSVPYLSKFFERSMGMNYTAYLNNVRLGHAVNELISTDHTIDVIAENNGFASSHSFVQIFKKKYDCLPSVYRKDLSIQMPFAMAENPNSLMTNYMELEQHNYLSILSNYLEQPTYGTVQCEKIIPRVMDISLNDEPTPLRHTFKRFCSVSKAKELLFSDVQDMLRRLQRDIGYEYIKFHGILSDDMKVYCETADGHPRISFLNVDKAIDFLLSIGLKPLIELGFMPAALAVDPTKQAFEAGYIISMPKDMSKWRLLVRELVEHLISRYGIDRVRSWPFTVWNEPDTADTLFGLGSSENIRSLYKESYNVIKKCDPEIKVGTPSFYSLSMLNAGWFISFCKWMQKNNCAPDFVLLHFYDLDFTTSNFSEIDLYNRSALKLSEDTASFSKFISIARNNLEQVGLGDLPVYLTEWNSTPAHRDLLSDTVFESAYIVKNLLENYDRLDSFCYWTLTDWNEEYQPSQGLFHGGLGMFTVNGIPKPQFYAFWLISKLGDNLLAKGSGYFVTEKNGEYRIMLYRYKHFSSMYANGELFDVTALNRYACFGEMVKHELDIRINGIADGIYDVKEYVLSRNHGSAFDRWLDMGAQELSSSEEYDILSSGSIPNLTGYTTVVSDNIAEFRVVLEDLSCCLIILHPTGSISED